MRPSLAQGPGAELAEALSADAVGPGVYVSITSVDEFPAEGGEAIFEPGTESEETFRYSSVDAEGNRLVGLDRPSPIDHPSGAFVQAPDDEVDPSPEPTAESPPGDSGTSETDQGASGDEPTDDEAASGETGSPDSESQSSATSSDTTASAEDASSVDATTTSAETSIIEDIVDLIDAALPAIGVQNPCSLLGIDCAVQDPCDPDGTGQTCLDYVADKVGVFIGNGPCDPDGTGQTCEEQVIDKLALVINDPDLFCAENSGSRGADFIGADDCAAFVTALDPGSPPQDCTSRIEYSLICAAYGATLVGDQDFGGDLVGAVVPAQPTEIGGIALPPPASGPGSSLDCFEGWHRFGYKNGRGELVGYGRVNVSWCGNDGTHRVRFFDPSYDSWVRWDWGAVLSIDKSYSNVVCDERDDDNGYCVQKTAWSSWDVYKGWCPYCQRRTPIMFFRVWWTGARQSDAWGY